MSNFYKLRLVLICGLEKVSKGGTIIKSRCGILGYTEYVVGVQDLCNYDSHFIINFLNNLQQATSNNLWPMHPTN
jgi:hypothetical protein